MKNLRPRPSRQRGAAILLAMLIMTLVATLAAGMVWLQWRGIEVESAERARGEGDWLLNGALDWGSLILKSSISRGSHVEDDLGQPWATPLEETKLSSFLSADGSHADDSGPEAYLSGQITDAQSRYNLYDLVSSSPTTSPRLEKQRLELLCTAVGVPASVADTIAAAMGESWTAQNASDPTQRNPTSVVMPRETSDLTWFGVDPAVVKQLEPFVELLPPQTTVLNAPPGNGPVPTLMNVNTAPPEVLMAAIPGMSRAEAEQLVQQRQKSPLTPANLATWIGKFAPPSPVSPTAPMPLGPLADIKSDYFEIYGQLRYQQHLLRERSVVHRVSAAKVDVIRRERLPPDVQ